MGGLCKYMPITWLGPGSFRDREIHLFPFGKEAIDREDLSGKGDVDDLKRVVWFVLAGWWPAIGHVMAAVACFVTIIGILLRHPAPQAAGIALAPIGKTIAGQGRRGRPRQRRRALIGRGSGKDRRGESVPAAALLELPAPLPQGHGSLLPARVVADRADAALGQPEAIDVGDRLVAGRLRIPARRARRLSGHASPCPAWRLPPRR